ncbi:bifunctional glycosyltransferase/CDP-glycerol:glycerophosphate glycerophosphotransferase [Streptacidiphilus carbonis]|uniref:bifunctional glycosyltransferase/CDP-glycerol:glycerophosphate glycerophosphotransferase n=1 Tax=Streptacidiphilus carbonis TaxID=105422 RepID=UPI0005A8ECF7|nr:CDP-glycerol:glycerophosphate glycerophosphotransferase [Streptacidiphilus carbonis]
MPRFSIVVPHTEDAAYLRDVLDSVLTQVFPDLELIVVGSASGGDAAVLIDEYAQRDPRLVRVQRTDGAPADDELSAERDLGAARAGGEYLLLLDRDVLLMPGALEALDERLTELGSPEVLLFDHEHRDWLGRIDASEDAELLAELDQQTDGVFATAAAPEVVRVTPLLWNRVLRRDFHAAQAASGPALVSAERTLLAARTVGALDAICVQRLRRRPVGRWTDAVLGDGLRVVQGYRQVLESFAAPDGRAVGTEEQRKALASALYDGMFLAALSTMGRSRETPDAPRRAFLTAAAEALRAVRPAGWTRPAEADGLRAAALEQGSYLRFRAVERAGATALKGRKQLRRRRNNTARRAMRAIYLANLRRPVEKGLVAYQAYWNRSIACNPEAIYRKAQEVAPGMRGVWVLNKEAAQLAPKGVPTVVVGSRGYWELMARAEFLVTNASWSGDVVKRPDQTYIQTHHGTPLKKMGLDQRDYPAASMNFARMLDSIDMWDVSLSSNRHSTQVWERVYPSGYTTLESGYPRNDVYQHATAADVARIRAGLGIEPGKKAILYAPTHRDYRKGFVPPLDLEAFCAGLGDEYVVLVRAHYFYGANKRLQLQSRRGVLRDVSAHPSVEELALASDALLADYSSVMFDYANLDRPIVVHAPDWEVYKESRGVYMDLVSGRPGDTPGVVATDVEGLIEAFRSGAWEGEESAKLRAAFRERFCQFDDGRAAERVVRRVFLREPGDIPFIPLDERTPAPRPSSLTGDDASAGVAVEAQARV